MARARTLKPSFFTSEQLASCSPLARLLFAGLWTICDRAGKLRDRPRKIKAELMPYEDAPDADAWLTELTRAGLLLRYEVGGERFVKVLQFEKHQHPHPKEPPSEIPEPGLSLVQPGKNTEGSSVSPFPSPVVPSPSCPLPDPRQAGGRVGVRLGSQSQKLIAAAEVGLKKGLKPLRSQADADELEAIIERRGYDAALEFVAGTCRSTDDPPNSVAWILHVLRPSSLGGVQ